MDFSNKITAWYEIEKRQLPWRDTTDPYRIWLSEIILQQTRVDQGLPYYNRYVSNYPSVTDLAKASEEQVLKLWQGLGYYSRARNLHHTAKYVANELDGVFPKNYAELLKLKGVGEYTAAAIASICYRENQAVVDGNVYRVLARIFGIHTPIDSTIGKKQFRELAQKLIKRTLRPDQHNQAVMEFGATHCTPKKPGCADCVFANDCVALQQDSVMAIPVKSNRTKQRNRFFNYLVIKHNNGYYLNKRDASDIWASLYDFPLIESDQKLLTPKDLRVHEKYSSLFQNTSTQVSLKKKEVKHVLSHQRIKARFFEVIVEDDWTPPHWIRVNSESVMNYAVPKLIENYLNDTGF